MVGYGHQMIRNMMIIIVFRQYPISKQTQMLKHANKLVVGG